MTKSDTMIQVHLRMLPAEVTAIKAAAREQEITPSAYMRAAILAALDMPAPRRHSLSPEQECLFNLYSHILSSFNRCANLFATAVLRRHDPAPALQAELRTIIAELKAERDQLLSS